MGWIRRAERRTKPRRPKPLPDATMVYMDEDGRLPDIIRVSFEDGTSATYKRDWQQPHPLCMASIRTIRKWNGYTPPSLREEQSNEEPQRQMVQEVQNQHGPGAVG